LIDNLSRRSERSGRACLSPRGAIEDVVARVFSVAATDIGQSTRGRAPVALARQVAMYLAHVALGMPMEDVGRLFSRDRTTVAHACGVVEDKRDNPDFDFTLEMLEWTVLALLMPRRRFPAD
jgi:chromosomal replication initiation ATPase DnaA